MKPMLAVTASLKDIELYLKNSSAICMPKFDGIRCVWMFEAFSRTLKPIRNLHIQRTLENEASYGQDGELLVNGVNKDSFSNTTSGVMTKDGEPDYTYNIFDNFEFPNKPYLDRLESIKEVNTNHIKFVDYLETNKLDDILAYEEKMLSSSYEGLILRNPNSKYKEGRSTLKEFGMVKLKRFADAEAVIIGFEELQENCNIAFTDELGHTKHSSHKENLKGKNTLGNIIVRDLVHGWEFSIGTGFDAKLRLEIWLNQDKWLGKIIKYKYFEVGMVDLPRSPVYLGVRSKEDM